MDKALEAVPPGPHGPLLAEAKRALYVLLMITAVESFIVTVTHDRPNIGVMALLALLSNFFVFLWYCRDSDALGYRRSLLLNIAFIMLGPFAVVYYLARSRVRGKRLRALLRLLGFVFLVAIASVIGTLAGRIAA